MSERPCANCGHADPHNGPAGDIADACTHEGCDCGYYSPQIFTSDVEAVYEAGDRVVRPAPPPHDLSPVVEELRRRMRDCPDEDWASADAERCEGCGLPSDARQETEDGVDLCPACYAAVPMTPRLHAESAALVAGLRQERDEARQIVADINNEVIGSHGWFTTPSCVEAVQKLKAESNRQYHEHQAEVAGLRQALQAVIAQMKVTEADLRDPETNGGQADDDAADILKGYRLSLAGLVPGQALHDAHAKHGKP